MIKNTFFLAAAVLLLMGSAGHGVWVQKNVMVEVAVTEMQPSTKHAIFVFLHQTTSVLFLSGMALLIAATVANASKTNALPWLIAAINVGNYLLFIGASLIKNKAALGQTMPQLLYMVLMVGFIIAGIRLQERRKEHVRP